MVIEISGTNVIRKMTAASLARNGSISSAIRSTRSPRQAGRHEQHQVHRRGRETDRHGHAHDDGEVQRIHVEAHERGSQHQAQDQDRGSGVEQHPDEEQQDQRILAEASSFA